MKVEIDQQQLADEIETLAAFSDAEAPAVTRVVFYPYRPKSARLDNFAVRKAGLAVRQDAVGNIFARWTGSDPAAPAVGTGSHIDAIPMPGSTTEWSEFSADWKRFARCRSQVSGLEILSNWLCSPRKSLLGSVLGVLEADYFQGRFPWMRLKSFPMGRVRL